MKEIIKQILLRIIHLKLTNKDDSLNELITSIKANGLLNPLVVREKENGRYEMISSTGLKDYIKNRLKLECNIKKILDTFNNKFDKESQMLGYLEKGKRIFIEKTIKMFDYSCKTNMFSKKITDLKNIYNCFQIIKSNVYSINIGQNISDLKEYLNDSKIKNLDSFLAISKTFKVDDKEYMPSTGEQTMIVLNEALNDRFDVYILDEPEKSLGNSYVNC